MKLELIDITKRFGQLVANDAVSLTVEEGEIHGLLGENGAGKTTLMNVLFGLLKPDSGEIRIGGQPVRISNPGDAVGAGIGMVHQHFMLVPVFTVAENVVLGFEPTKAKIFYDRRKAAANIRRLSVEYGLEVDPDAIVEDIPVGVQQRVEILKALERNANVLILDEPTAVLTPQETEALFRIMRSLASTGRSILFISHKLKEVREIADRVTVMRLGKVVGTTTPAESSEQQLASMMVGRSVVLTVTKDPAVPGDVVLELKNLTVADDRDLVAVDGVNLEVRAGEIVALAGVQGNGQTELVEAITGLRNTVAGSVVVAGEDLTHATPRHRLHAGIAHVPEDRQKDALVLPMDLADNLVLDMYGDPPYAGRTSRNLGAVKDNAERRVREFDIRARSVGDPVSSLSGGNQQKVVLAREFGRPVKLVVASQPTRGLDVGSIEYVHKRIVAERDQGTAVLIISSELDEVLALGDRIAVMYRGRIMGVVDPSVGREHIGLMMAGVADEAAPDGGVAVAAPAGGGGVDA
ncbi:MAG TPA: ABC transporter ATP-binding protein [Acidimicrobiales bacterium]|jgi:simple sugar transport system ATP-binding protein|nr:ABC transporter ATP-binding protein [Acidimicrobiales bacterium]